MATAYRYCADVARRHYENFPVASVLLPARLRKPIAVIYAFSRSADDLADEGALGPEERLQRLDAYRVELDRLRAGQTPSDPVFVALADVIARNSLPWLPFYDLLHAFRQDVTKRRYAHFTEVLEYCRCSANPVGRLLLHLDDQASEANLRRSDALCTALQLINFYQDMIQDYDEMDRIYLPLDEMARFGVTEQHLRERQTDAPFHALMQTQLARARALLAEGAPLAWALRGRLAWELRLITAGGFRILEKLERLHDDVFARPRLRRFDWLLMVGTALRRLPPRR